MAFLAVRLRDIAILDHAVDDPVAALDGAFALLEGMIIIRRLGQRGEIGGLGHRQFMHRLAIIVQRRGGDAVIPEAEIDLVQIKLEDLFLRIGRLDAEREQGFPDLAFE